MINGGKRVLVIGGTRFFGRGIVDTLHGAGYAVTMLTRGRRASSPPAPDIEWIVGDRKDAETLRRIAHKRQFYAVIDNVCYEPDEARMAARALVDRTEKYVFTSTVMSYLNGYLSGMPLREEDWPRQSSTEGMLRQYNPAEVTYALNKRGCEEVFFASMPDRIIVFRLHNVVGLDDFSGKSGAIVNALGADACCRLPGRPDDTLQTVLADDIGRLYLAAVFRPKNGGARVYNVSLPPISQGRFVELLIAETPFDLSQVTFTGGDGAWGADDVTAPFPRNVVLDVSRLEKDFGAFLTPYDAFVPAMGRWYVTRQKVTT
jgi:nucleoside-diphosphate-sugar epimerase